jgi:Na+/H+ antiporter NhaC
LRGKSVFYTTILTLFLFFITTIILGIYNNDNDMWSFNQLKESFKWVTSYVLPWIMLYLLIMIARK